MVLCRHSSSATRRTSPCRVITPATARLTSRSGVRRRDSAYILRSEDFLLYAFPWGLPTDIPTPGDYDGDGKIDASIFRPSEATWFLNRSTAGVFINNSAPQPMCRYLRPTCRSRTNPKRKKDSSAMELSILLVRLSYLPARLRFVWPTM